MHPAAWKIETVQALAHSQSRLDPYRVLEGHVKVKDGEVLLLHVLLEPLDGAVPLQQRKGTASGGSLVQQAC